MKLHKHQRAESEMNENVEQYEKELKIAKLNEGRQGQYNSIRKRSIAWERRGRNKSRNTRSERQRNSLNDKKKRLSKSKHTTQQ